MNAIVSRWQEAGYPYVAEGLMKAPQGAASGTEGLLIMIEHLAEMTWSNPTCIGLIRPELMRLVEYCSSSGIFLDDKTIKAFVIE